VEFARLMSRLTHNNGAAQMSTQNLHKRVEEVLETIHTSHFYGSNPLFSFSSSFCQNQHSEFVTYTQHCNSCSKLAFLHSATNSLVMLQRASFPSSTMKIECNQNSFDGQVRTPSSTQESQVAQPAHMDKLQRHSNADVACMCQAPVFWWRI
jgi:hypothetical protein